MSLRDLLMRATDGDTASLKATQAATGAAGSRPRSGTPGSPQQPAPLQA